MKAYCSLYDFLPSLSLMTELNSFARVLDLLWRPFVFMVIWCCYLCPNVWCIWTEVCIYLFRCVMSWSNTFPFASLISRTSMRSQRLMLCSVTMSIHDCLFMPWKSHYNVSILIRHRSLNIRYFGRRIQSLSNQNNGAIKRLVPLCSPALTH